MPHAAHARVRGEVQPQELPCVIANRIADSPAARPAAPSQSIVPVVLRGRAGHDEDHDGDDEDGEGGGEPEDAVVVGAVVHQQADDDESGSAAEAQRRRKAPTSPTPCGLRTSSSRRIAMPTG